MSRAFVEQAITLSVLALLVVLALAVPHRSALLVRGMPAPTFVSYCAAHPAMCAPHR